MTNRALKILPLVAALALSAACDEKSPFINTPPAVFTTTGQVWELGLEGFPSAYGFTTARRYFVGVEAIGAFEATWLLDGLPGGPLTFRPYSTYAPAVSLLRVGIQDLGAVPYASITVAPESGYSDVNDSTGVAVVEGHVYAFRISQLGQGVTPINYAKLEVIEVDREFPEEPGSRFVRFRYSYQIQPLNRDIAEAE